MLRNLAALALGAACLMTAADAPAQRTAWFYQARWGVFIHYLGSKDVSVEEWNRRIDNFDVEGLARQLASVHASYLVLTLGQNSGHYLSPNHTYDSYVGLQPSKCSRRDLIADMYAALAPKGIQLMVYLPAGAPDQDEVAMAKLEWRKGPHRNREFQLKWEHIIAEWSQRWGTKVRGWWFDGCYWPDEMYRQTEAPNFASFARAARAGNPNSIVAFNPGVKIPIISESDEEDYTAGETNEPDKVTCPGRWIGHAQAHMLTYLGENWSHAPVRFTPEQAAGWTSDFVARGGVVTWDVPTSQTGLIPEAFMERLQAIGKAALAVQRAE